MGLSHLDAVSAARAVLRECLPLRLPLHFLRLCDRAPPARRFAGQARSHICCNVPNLSGHGCQPWWVDWISELALLPHHLSQAIHPG